MPTVWFVSLMIAAAGVSRLQAQKGHTISTLDGWNRGTLRDGGANTYVAADGGIRLINVRDLNRDGSVDLVFANTHEHNEKLDLFLYWGKRGFDARRKTPLPAEGAESATAADLNGDGYPELIVANRFDGTKTELNSYVYWGGAQGFGRSRRSELPTQGAEAVAAGDLNGDGFADIVFANSGLSYHVSVDAFQKSFIYWGSKSGFSPDRRTTVKTINSRDVKIADLDRDGFPDLIFANEGNEPGEGGASIYWGAREGRFDESRVTNLPGERSSSVDVRDLNGDSFPDLVLANSFRLKTRELGMYNIVDTDAIDSFVYWGSAKGFSVTARTALPTKGARHTLTADLNGDGLADIAFANHSGPASYVYWNSPQGFSSERRADLPSRHATHLAAADFDKDGRTDLAIANFSSGASHDTDSWVYLNSGGSFPPARRTALPTHGASGVIAADFDRDGEPDLAFLNKIDGIDRDPLDSWIYWGNPKGEYSAARRQALPAHNVNAYSAADLNADGFPDLYFPGSPQLIYWGSAEGRFDPKRHTVLSKDNAFSAQIADFNRDGYLDIATSQWSPAKDEVSLYWGSANGFSADRRFLFRIGELRFHAAADLNRDQWLDIVFTTTDNRVVIAWNSASGFDNQRRTVLPSEVAISTRVADLNQDGYLDIVICNLWSKNPPPGKPRSFGGSPEAGTYVYWGSKDGYDVSRRLTLPSTGNEDASVADLNRDGWLDLVLTSYHAGNTRANPSYIFWNGPRGFDPSSPTRIETNSGSGVIAADFNRDGHKDLLFACHSKDGNHRNDSYLYWGGLDGFSPGRRLLIPGKGPHLFNLTDIGNVHDRTDRYDYISEPIEGDGSAWSSISWKAETPFRTRVEFQVRSARTQKELESAEWKGASGPDSVYSRPGPLQAADGRWLQFKATLVSPDDANTPVLRSVTVR